MTAESVREQPLTPELTLVDILDDLLWHSDGRVSLVYRVEALHEPGLSDDDFDKHAFLAENVFNSGIPDKTAWQFFVLVDHEAGLRHVDDAFPPIADHSPSGRLFEEFRQAKIRELTRVELKGTGASLLQARRHYVVVSFAPALLQVPILRELVVGPASPRGK